MKFETSNRDKKFQPFAVSMVFESRDEAQVWADMLSWNVSIPRVAKVPDRFEEMVTTQMSSFRQAIQDGLKNES